MNYLVLKTIHLIAVVCWFAGLFYMGRLFIYHKEAEKRTDMTGSVNNDSTPKSRIESIAGDVDRTVSTSDFKETLKTWTQIYIYETDRLALHLYVPNYRNPEQARYRFNREGAEFIQALPGPADVAVGTRLLLETNYR